MPDGFGGRKDFLLGTYGTKASKAEYERVIGEWLARGRRLDRPAASDGASLNELMVAYLAHCRTFYVKDGKPTGEVDAVKLALRFIKPLYGHTPAAKFSPVALQVVRQAMLDHKISRKLRNGTVKVYAHGLSRRTINKAVQRIIRMFRWAASEGLVTPEVPMALQMVPGLRRGRSGARELPRVKPVHESVVAETLVHLPEEVADMVLIQQLTGMRPGEVVQLAAADMDMTGEIWEFRPGRHKGQHLDRERIVFIGPQAQAILKKYLCLDITAPLFSPRRSETKRNAARRAARKSPMTPSQAARKPRKRKHKLRDAYDVASYRRAINRACCLAGVPMWSPNALRHAAGTKVRKMFGLEAAQSYLGHAELGVTQVYAEVDLARARTVAKEIG